MTHSDTLQSRANACHACEGRLVGPALGRNMEGAVPAKPDHMTASQMPSTPWTEVEMWIQR